MLRRIKDTNVNAQRYKEVGKSEVIVEKVILSILREGGSTEFVERYIPLKLIQRFSEKNYLNLTIRQLRYIIDKLVSKKRIDRRFVYDKEKKIRRGIYKKHWTEEREKAERPKNNIFNLSSNY